MCEIPRITGEQAVAAFKKAGFFVDRIKGAHHIMKRQGHRYNLSIPCHKGKTIGKGLLSQQIQNAGLTVEQFIAFL